MPNETPKVKISINGTAIMLAAVALVAFWAGGCKPPGRWCGFTWPHSCS